jgi:signal transduction histidine kinase
VIAAPKSEPSVRVRPRLAFSAALLAAGLFGVVLAHRAATRAELDGLLREQALVVRRTVGAAARVNAAAGREAEEQITARLLGTARLLATVDRAGRLDARTTDAAARDGLFRVTVLGPDGVVEMRGGAVEVGHGRGFGSGGAAGGLAQRVLAGEEEVATGVHRARRHGGDRVAAGVRRANGGAILVHAEADEVGRLLRQGSLDALFDEIVRTSPEVVFLVFEHGDDGVRAARGDSPTAGPAGLPEREVEVGGRPVLELTGPVELGGGRAGVLRIGLGLDRLRRADRRMAWLLAMVMAACLGLAALGVRAAWLSALYERLSAKHARAEEALRRRDRLTAMGELAGTVAHEVRNPLNAISMGVQRLRREFGAEPGTTADTAERDELLRVVEAEVERLDGLVEQFLQFARPRPVQRAATDVAGLVRDVVEASRAAAEARGLTLVAEPDGAGQAALDAAQMRQVLDNLVRNAIEATPPGGRVAVRAGSEARGISVSVEDDGPGIPPEDLPRIFGLYFTTKPGGSGVGLAVAQQIVTAHDGTIEVESRLGQGTRMTVRLPASAEAAHA